MDQRLRDAAEQGNIDDLYLLIGSDAKVLDWFDEIPFVDTPLHIAASAGQTRFAMEVMTLKPSFARKLNQHGFTPMHLALRKLHEHQNNPDLQRNLTQLVHQLLDVEKDLVRVKGKGGVTPLHYVAEIGNIKFLAKFFKACPESLEDVTIRGESVLHIALKHDMVEAFLLLVRRIWRTSYKDARLLEEKLLCSQDDERNILLPVDDVGNNLLPVDDEGNTLLHVAVSRNQPKVVSWLLNRGFANLNAKNLEDDTVFDLNAKNLERHTVGEEGHTVVDLNANNLGDNLRIKDMLMRQQRLLRLDKLLIKVKGTISRAVIRQQRTITEERRNALLVVAALLITVTYQAALGPDQPPNQFNCTAWFNATAGANLFNCTAWFNANSNEVNSSPLQGFAFYFINTITYYLSNATLLFLLPPNFISIVLYYLLGLLFLCYCTSTPILNAPFVSIFGIVLLPTFSILSMLTGVTIRPGKLLPLAFFYFGSLYVLYLEFFTSQLL